MRRIHIIGTSGSGKTTLASQLAAMLDIPHVELDAIQWQPDWTPLDKDAFRERLAEALSEDDWVVDGNYFAYRDLTHARADTLIWLDYPLPLVLWRVTARTGRRLIQRTELWNGNHERLRSVFSRDSIIVWALTSYSRNRRRYRQLLANPAPDLAHLRIIRLRSPRATAIWLRSLAAAQPHPIH
jgi:adenylate kinase family enzyme